MNTDPNSKRARPWITCRCCKGSGWEMLPAQLWATLKMVQRLGPDVPTDRIVIRGVKPTTMNNRLVALERLRFVVRTGKIGKVITWSYSDSA